MLEILLALPFVLALVIAPLRRASRRTMGWLAAVAPLLGLGYHQLRSLLRKHGMVKSRRRREGP